jgi:hypothetical protein
MKKIFLLAFFFLFAEKIFSQSEYVIVRGYVRGVSSSGTYTGQVKNAEIKITVCDTIILRQFSRENGYYEFYIEKAPVTAKLECIANRNTHFNNDNGSQFSSFGFASSVDLSKAWINETDFLLKEMTAGKK